VELLGNLQSVVIGHFSPRRLASVSGCAAFPLFNQLLDFLDDFVPPAIPNIGFVAAFIMADMICHGHKYWIVIDPTSSGFYCDQLVRLALKYQHARLNADIGLKSIGVEVNAREDSRVVQNPFANVTQSRRAQDAIRKNYRGATGAGFQKFNASLDEQNLGWLGFCS